MQKAYHDDEEILNEATKPEVVITKCRYDIEIQFRRLHIGFRGRQSQWNIDRHQVCIVLHEFSQSGNTATSKPEVVITIRGTR